MEGDKSDEYHPHSVTEVVTPSNFSIGGSGICGTLVGCGASGGGGGGGRADVLLCLSADVCVAGAAVVVLVVAGLLVVPLSRRLFGACHPFLSYSLEQLTLGLH